MLKQSYLLASLALLGLAATFFQQWYPLAISGAGAATDALIAGMVLPQFLITMATGAVSATLTPLLVLAPSRNFAAIAWSLAFAVGILLAALAAVIWISSSFWLPFLTPGFSVGTRDLAANLMGIQLIGLPFAGVATAQISALQARGCFLRAESLSAVAQLMGVAVTVLALPAMGMTGAALGILTRYVVIVPLLHGALGNPSGFAWDAETVRSAWVRMRPLFLGTAFARIDQLFDVFLASLAGAGWVSLFNLAMQFHGAGNLVVSRAIARPLIPSFTLAARHAEWPSIQNAYSAGLGNALAWSAVGLVLIAITGITPIALIFRGFSHDSLISLWWLIIASAGVLVAGSMAQIPVVGFYAIGDTKTPTRVAIYGVLFGLTFKAVGYSVGGVTGLAVATSLYYATNFIALHAIFRRRITRPSRHDA